MWLRFGQVRLKIHTFDNSQISAFNVYLQTKNMNKVKADSSQVKDSE